MSSEFRYYWLRKGPRQNDLCRVVDWLYRNPDGVSSRVLIEFEDGERVECTRNDIRMVKRAVQTNR